MNHDFKGRKILVTGAFLFLAGDAQRYITGKVIEVNGGMLMD